MLSLMLSLSLGAAPAQMTLVVKPAATEVFVDGKKQGTGAKPVVVKVRPGKHVLRYVFKGDAHEEEVAVKAGEKPTFKWEFDVPEDSKPSLAPTEE
jgi:hypothetical protein